MHYSIIINIMEQSNMISLTIRPVYGESFRINIEENNNINDLIQIIENYLVTISSVRKVDGRNGWHLFSRGKNLYNPLSSLDEYNITEGVIIDILPGNRARDLVSKHIYTLADMRRAKRLSIRSELLRKRREHYRFKQTERSVCDVPSEPFMGASNEISVVDTENIITRW